MAKLIFACAAYTIFFNITQFKKLLNLTKFYVDQKYKGIWPYFMRNSESEQRDTQVSSIE